MPGNPFRGMLGDYLRAVQLKQQHEQAIQQHDLAVKQLEELHSMHTTENERRQQELDLRKTLTAQQLMNAKIEHIAKGIEQPPESAQPTGFQQNFSPGSQDITTDQQGNLNLPTGIPTSLSKTGSQFQLSEQDLGGLARYLSPTERNISVATPEHLAQLAASAAGQKTVAEEAAKAPLELAKTKELVGGRETVARIVAEQRAKTAEDKNASLLDRMNHIDATRKYVADHASSNLDEGELSQQVEDIANGTGDLKDVPAKNRIHAKSILTNQGKVEFGKAKGDQINALNDFDGLVQDMHTAANMLPDTSPGLQQAEQFGNKLISKLPWQTDLKNAMASVKAKSPGIVRAIGGVGSGRVTNTEIQAQMDNLINAGMNKQQALGKIAQFERDTYTKAYSDIMGAVPTHQKVAIMSKHGGLDRWRGVNIQRRDGTVGPVISKMQNGKEAMYNSNTGNYEGIEDYK